MTTLESLEAKGEEIFVKNAPFQLPANARQWIADYMWLFALIGVILGGLAVLALLPFLGLASVLGTAVGAGNLVLFAWLSFFVLVAYVVVLAISVPKLKRKQKSGWDLTFYSMLFFFAYDVLNWIRFADFGAVFGLLWQLIWLAVGLYLLFQVRTFFVRSEAKAKLVK